LEKFVLVIDGKTITEKNCQSCDMMLRESMRERPDLEARAIFSSCAMIDAVGGVGVMGNEMELVDEQTNRFVCLGRVNASFD
jgi:hypothetical protein